MPTTRPSGQPRPSPCYPACCWALLSGAGVTLAITPPHVAFVLVPLVALVLLADLFVGVAGKVFAEAIVDTLWPITPVVRFIALPLTAALRVIEQVLEWSAGQSSSARHRPAHLQVEIPVEDDDELSEDEEPDLPESARTLLQQTVALTRTDISGLMTPRSLIVSLPSTVSSIEAAATFRRTGLSRVPIFQESRDDIVGVLYAKDLFARMTEARSISAVSPREMVRPVLFVPETKNAYELLRRAQNAARSSRDRSRRIWQRRRPGLARRPAGGARRSDRRRARRAGAHEFDPQDRQ